MEIVSRVLCKLHWISCSVFLQLFNQSYHTPPVTARIQQTQYYDQAQQPMLQQSQYGESAQQQQYWSQMQQPIPQPQSKANKCFDIWSRNRGNANYIEVCECCCNDKCWFNSSSNEFFFEEETIILMMIVA